MVNVVYFSLLHQRTPLHMAAEGGHIDTVKYLVDKKASINTKDTDEVSARDHTTDRRQPLVKLALFLGT